MPNSIWDPARFQDFVRKYPANPCEIAPPSHWLDLQKTRHALTLGAFSRHRPESQTLKILDVGAFPGSLVKCLRLFLHESGPIEAAGLASDERFLSDLAALEIPFLQVNLDPIVGSYLAPSTERTRLEREDAYYDVAFCTEMIEHTLDPLYALREIARVLRPGGILVLTTPNQAVLSHRLRLLLGKSIYFDLKGSIMYQSNDWRPHFREYTQAEMETLVRDGGFEIVESSFMDLTYDDARIWGWKHPALRLAKEFARFLMRIPSLRHNLLLVGRRVISSPSTG